MTSHLAGRPKALMIVSAGSEGRHLSALLEKLQPSELIVLCRSNCCKGVELTCRPHLVHPSLQIVQFADDTKSPEILRKVRALGDRVYEWNGVEPREAGRPAVTVATTEDGCPEISLMLTLVAVMWDCSIIRTDAHLGATSSPQSDPPWDTLGLYWLGVAVERFNAGAYGRASELLSNASKLVTDARAKAEIEAVARLMAAYSCWDRFDYKEALRGLERAAFSDLSELLSVFPDDRSVRGLIEGSLVRLRQIQGSPDKPEAVLAKIHDIVRSAEGRMAEGRYDDAILRFYRATEALAQLQLREVHGLDLVKDNGLLRVKVLFAKLPDDLKGKWGERESTTKPNAVQIRGLQESMELLHDLGDALGQQFTAMQEQSGFPLKARNSSMLVHGWTPVGEPACRRWRDSLRELHAFPTLERWTLPWVKQLSHTT